jgi:myo-inositol-1(or 4)-monophosphatase
MFPTPHESTPPAQADDADAALPPAESLADWRALAEHVTRRAGELARRQFRETRQIQHKGFRDIVTEVDLAAQQLIVEAVQRHHPDHGFLAEEEDAAVPSELRPVQWIIDPVDGTSNYSRQIPIFCISVAVAVRGRVVVGAIYDPMRDELFSAAHGRGSTLNGARMAVSTTPTVADSMVSLDWCRAAPERAATLDALQIFGREARSIRGIGSAALALAWVAAGRLDAYFNLHLYPWDLAAGGLLITEAGGRVTDVAGQPLSLRPAAADAVRGHRINSGLATNGRIHDELCAMIAVPDASDDA